MAHLGMSKLCMIASAAMSIGLASAQGRPDSFPSRPVTIIVANTSGGPVDLETRLYAGKLGELIGQPCLLDFRPGAGGTVGGAYVAKAAPDGHTLLAVTAGFTSFPSLYRNLSFDTTRDFAPVTLMSQRVSVLLAHPAFAPRNFSDYIAYARANPGKINHGTTGAGGIIHLTGAWMHNATNTRVTFVHYKGAAAEMLDLIAGRIDVASTTLLAAQPLLKSGKVRALAVLNEKRSNLLPEVATIAEQGIPEYNYASWLGIVAPRATPSPAISKLSDGLIRVSRMPAVIATLGADGSTMVGNTPAQFAEIIAVESERWRKLVQATGIKLED